MNSNFSNPGKKPGGNFGYVKSFHSFAAENCEYGNQRKNTGKSS